MAWIQRRGYQSGRSKFGVANAYHRPHLLHTAARHYGSPREQAGGDSDSDNLRSRDIVPERIAPLSIIRWYAAVLRTGDHEAERR